MHADIDESAEVGNVGHHPFQRHARLQVLQRLHPGGVLHRTEFRAWVAAGLLQLGDHVANGVGAVALGFQSRAVDLLQSIRLLQQLLQWQTAAGGNRCGQRIAFRVYGGVVQRLLAIANAQETGALFKRLGSQSRHLEQLAAVAQRAMLVAPGDDVVGGGAVETGHMAEQSGGCGVHVHAHMVDAVFDDSIKRLAQTALVHVVLVLADADRLGIDLDQFCQRVLQPAGDGNGTADGDVNIREFGGGQSRGGIDRGTGFVDQYRLDILLGQCLAHRLGQLLGFARGGAVAHGDQLDPVLFRQCRQGVQ